MFFKIIALSPFVFSALKKALFKITDCIYFVEMLKDLSRDIISSNPALSYPQKPLFSIVALKQLHFDVLFLVLGAKIYFLQSEFNAVVLKHFYISDFTLRVYFDVREKSLVGKDLSILHFFNEFVKFAFAWFDFCIFYAIPMDIFFITFILTIDALRLEFEALEVLCGLAYMGRHMRSLRSLGGLLNRNYGCILA
jgi:hypothetical protein